MRSTWIEVDGRSVALHVFEPPARAAGVVIVVPSFGFEAEVAYRTMHSLAWHAADAGLLAVLPDLTGYGDSGDAHGVDDLGQAWIADVEAAIRFGRAAASGVPVTVIGFRIGAGVMARLPIDVADARIAWEGVSGKRFLRRQRLLSTMARRPHGDKGSELHGLALTSAQVTSVGALPGPDARTCTVMADAGGAPPRTVAFDTDPYRHEVPLARIEQLVGLCVRGEPVSLSRWDVVSVSPAPLRPRRAVVERFERVGPQRLHAVVTLPANGAIDASTCVVFSAQGAERCSGPAGLWATLSRDLAASGFAAMRVDRRLIGWHLDAGSRREPNPFGSDAIEDVVEAVREARRRGFERVVVVSSCAGAWLALAAARRIEIDDVVAFGVPAWSATPEHLDTTFLDYWHGVVPVDVARSRRAASRRRWIRVVDARPAQTSPTALVRVRRRLGRVRRSLAFRSVGLPLLRRVPRSTAVTLVHSGSDRAFFTASAGHTTVRALRARGHDIEVREIDGLDHALRTAHARTLVTDCVEEAVSRVSAWRRDTVSALPDSAA